MTITLTHRDVERMDTTPNGIPYEYGLTVRGAYFTLYKVPGKTLKDIQTAKRYLKTNRDVVGIDVVKQVTIESEVD